MSKIFDRSRDTLKQYFSQVEEFERKLAKYIVNEKTIQSSSNRYGCSGDGGVPLLYNENNEVNSSYIVVDNSDTHTLVMGATASKKSRLVAMPMVKILENAKESMIIVDPKSEIFDRTSESLKENGYTVYTIDLRNPHFGNAWNPLAIPYSLYVKNGPNDIDRACEFVNDIANNLSKMQLSNDKDPYWENSAASFFFGLIMLLFNYVSQNDLSAEYVNIRNILKLRNILCDKYYAGQPPTPAITYARTNPFIYSLLIGTLDTAKNTQSGILSTFDQKMRTFAIQPSLLDMLASDDNIIEGVRQIPTAIFLIVPDEKTSYHNLVSLFIKQSYEYFIYSSQNNESKNERQRINYILDEFSSLPTINDFPAMITAARSRDIRFTLFVQSKHQLDLRYKQEAETIRANCNNWIFLVSREVALLQELSILCGTRRLENGAFVPVLSITDLQRLDKEKGEALILCGRQKPLISNLLDIKYFDNDNFKKPIRVIQERGQYEIDFKFKSLPVKKPLSDWSIIQEIEPINNKAANQLVSKNSNYTDDNAIIASPFNIEDTKTKPTQAPSAFNSFFEQLVIDNLDKSDCSSLSEQQIDIKDLKSASNDSSTAADAITLQKSVVKKRLS